MVRLMTRLVLAGFVGVVVGLGAFALTSGHGPLLGETGGLCTNGQIQEPYFDLWTGQAHGFVLTCSASSSGPWQIHGGITEDMEGRWWVIPLPVGFLAGALLVLRIGRRDTGPGSRLQRFAG
jgi:H+/Cl- antiporter ClcA